MKLPRVLKKYIECLLAEREVESRCPAYLLIAPDSRLMVPIMVGFVGYEIDGQRVTVYDCTPEMMRSILYHCSINSIAIHTIEKLD